MNWFSKTDLRLIFTPNKLLKQIRKQLGGMTSLPLLKFGLGPFSTPQLLIGISPSYDIENAQTRRRWKDISKDIPTISIR